MVARAPRGDPHAGGIDAGGIGAGGIGAGRPSRETGTLCGRAHSPGDNGHRRRPSTLDSAAKASAHSGARWREHAPVSLSPPPAMSLSASDALKGISGGRRRGPGRPPAAGTPAQPQPGHGIRAGSDPRRRTARAGAPVFPVVSQCNASASRRPGGALVRRMFRSGGRRGPGSALAPSAGRVGDCIDRVEHTACADFAHGPLSAPALVAIAPLIPCQPTDPNITRAIARIRTVGHPSAEDKRSLATRP